MKLRTLAQALAFCVLGIAIFGACSCSKGPTTAVHRSAIAEQAAGNASPSRATAPMSNHSFVRTYSVANLERDVLEDCIDFTIRVAPPNGSAPDWAAKGGPDLPTQLAQLGRAIRTPCIKQFADRLVLATCIAITKRDGQELQLVQRYYNPDTVGMDDIYMQECLRLGGTWDAIAVDSPEFRKAQLEAKLRGLEALAAGSG